MTNLRFFKKIIIRKSSSGYVVSEEYINANIIFSGNYILIETVKDDTSIGTIN